MNSPTGDAKETSDRCRKKTRLHLNQFQPCLNLFDDDYSSSSSFNLGAPTECSRPVPISQLLPTPSPVEVKEPKRRRQSSDSSPMECESLLLSVKEVCLLIRRSKARVYEMARSNEIGHLR